jgi:PAS domain S-box-containing protein
MTPAVASFPTTKRHAISDVMEGLYPRPGKANLLPNMTRDVHFSPRTDERRYEAVVRLSEVLSACQDSEELTKVLSDQLHEFLAFLQFYIIVYRESSTEVDWAVVGREKSLVGAYADVAVEERPSWQAYTTQEPFHIYDWSANERVPARLKAGISAQGLDVGPLVFVPLTTPHRRLGALGMSGAPGTVYTTDDINFLRLIGRVVALAIENNLNLKRAEDTQRELQVQNERIVQSERELREVIETIPAMAWSATPDGAAEFFNGRWLAYAGLTIDQARGWGWTLVVHPDDLDGLVDYWRMLMTSGKSGEIEGRLRRFDGVYRWFLFRATPSVDEMGRIVKWYGTNTDIEERKTAEQALQRSEAYLAEAQRLTLTGSYATDGITRQLIYWSEEMFRLFGFDPQQGLPMWDQWLGRIHPEDRQEVMLAADRAFVEKVDSGTEFRIMRLDGTVRIAHGIGHPLLGPNGEIFQVVGTVVDITERRRAEEALKSAFDEIKRLKDELYRENLALRDEIDRSSMFEEIVGTSEPLRAVLSRIAKVAPTDSTVFITGETGTGKELIARAIHKRSPRSGRAFVSVNCAALAPSLISSELFGHEKGAFTGATQKRLGRFEMADGGTSFLDEVGELPSDIQVALLRVLQEREFERVGGNRSIKVDVRVIAATNRDLEAAVAKGGFREDLFYRLNVFPIEVPPLRQRRDDILMLVEYFVQRYAKRAGKNISSIEKKTLNLLQSYDWPGNIRELQNVIERSMILSSGEVLSVDGFWLSKKNAPPPKTETSPVSRVGRWSEREVIQAALLESKGRISGPTGAAAKLGIPPSTLDYRIRALRINKREFKFR